MIDSNALGSAFNEVSPSRDSAGYFTSLPTSERMRVSPRAFSLEKAMLKFKSTPATEFYITKDGMLAVKQYSDIEGKEVIILLPPYQMDELIKLVADFKADIEQLWNNGLDADYQPEDDHA
jgi:hypothetical protein